MIDVYEYDGMNVENEHALMYFRVYSLIKLDPNNQGSNEYIHTGMFCSKAMFYLSRRVIS